MPFLLVREGFHPERNRARQILAALPTTRFEKLSRDVYFELARRYTGFKDDVRALNLLSHSFYSTSWGRLRRKKSLILLAFNEHLASPRWWWNGQPTTTTSCVGHALCKQSSMPWHRIRLGSKKYIQKSPGLSSSSPHRILAPEHLSFQVSWINKSRSCNTSLPFRRTSKWY